MEKNYTNLDYIKACGKANAEGKIVQLVQNEVAYDVEVLEWNYEDQEVEQQKIDPETGELLFDEEGNPITEIVTIRVRTTPIMVEEEIENPETGEKELVIVQKHHTETRTKIVEVIELVESDTRALKLKSELKEIDEKTIRSIRAILSENATDEDKTYLASLETKAQAIREELANIKE